MSLATVLDKADEADDVFSPRGEMVVSIPPSVRSLQGFRDWYATDSFPEDGRISYLAGEIVIDMGHERISSHVDLKGEIFHRLKALLEEMNIGKYFGDGVRLVNEHADLSSEPDGCFISWDTFAKGGVHLHRDPSGTDATEVLGSPDMVLEVVSRSSVAKDKVTLRDLYHRAGIREFWLVDARRSDIAFDILVAGSHGYVQSGADGDWRVSPVFSRRFRLERTLDPLGLWQYRLYIQKHE
jgi:Uma2 family endonuclease